MQNSNFSLSLARLLWVAGLSTNSRVLKPDITSERLSFVIMYLAGKVNPLEYPYIALSFDSAFHIVSVPSLRKLSP